MSIQHYTVRCNRGWYWPETWLKKKKQLTQLMEGLFSTEWIFHQLPNSFSYSPEHDLIQTLNSEQNHKALWFQECFLPCRERWTVCTQLLRQVWTTHEFCLYLRENFKNENYCWRPQTLLNHSYMPLNNKSVHKSGSYMRPIGGYDGVTPFSTSIIEYSKI